MIRGSRLSARALYPRIRAQEIIANNLANAQNDGFRRERIAFHSVLDEQVAGGWPEQSLVGARDDASAGVATTGNPLDFAVVGSGFFVVGTPDGERLTRSGSFTIGTGGELRTPEGHAVLGTGGPLLLEGGEVTATPDGTIRVDGTPAGTLRIASVDASELTRVGENLFSVGESVALGGRPDGTTIAQGALETSNVEPVIELVEMIRIHREYESNYKAMTVQGDTLKKLIDQEMRG